MNNMLFCKVNKDVFKIVIAVVVQSIFYLEMYQNKKKIIFNISLLKRFENIKKFILSKKIKNLKKYGLHRVSKHTLNVFGSLLDLMIMSWMMININLK
jgi:hypothetical protein